MALAHEDYDLDTRWKSFCSCKAGGDDHFINDPCLVESFELIWGVIYNQGCSIPENPPRYECDFCCNCDKFRHNGIAVLAQVQDQDDDSGDEDDDSDDEVELNVNVDELVKQIERQNFELVYDAENNWMVYKYPLCRMCWEMEREFQQA